MANARFRAVFALCAGSLLGACQTPAEHQSVQRARMDKQAAVEADRICGLPEERREAELKKIQEQSGVTLYCAGK